MFQLVVSVTSMFAASLNPKIGSNSTVMPSSPSAMSAGISVTSAQAVSPKLFKSGLTVLPPRLKIPLANVNC